MPVRGQPRKQPMGKVDAGQRHARDLLTAADRDRDSGSR
jgi:hypothetical protein